MTEVIVAEFENEKALLAATRAVDPKIHRIRDALTPSPVEAIGELIPEEPSRIRLNMLMSGALTAAFAYGLQAYSSVIAYPLNSGGRPLHSWPVFLLVPIEVGILAAGLSGMISFFRACRLPRLHHALFEVPGIERASQDRYFLLLESDEGDDTSLRGRLEDAGAVAISRVPQP